MSVAALTTDRLLLRQWEDEDLIPFAALCADPEVMEHFPAPLTPEQSADLVGRQRALLDAGKPGLFAVEVEETGEFIGLVGFAVPAFTAPFTPCVEIGWRLARTAWGRGFATEAGAAVLEHGFATLDLSEIVSFTTRANLRSRAVMERLGMSYDPSDDFNHPALARDNPLRAHVLYRLHRDGAGAVTSDTGSKPTEQG